MKFLLFRSFGNINKRMKDHELVAVEFGTDINDVTDRLIQEVQDDLSSLSEYKDYLTDACAPEAMAVCDVYLVSKYKYTMDGLVIPPGADENIVIEYGVEERDEQQ